jgi:glutaredoxin-related protein
MINIKTNNVLNFLELCEKSQEIVARLDYQHARYGIKYTMCLMELSDELLEKGVNLKRFLRLTDEVANINDKYKFIFFAHASIENTYKALLALEKAFIRNHFSSSYGLLFKASIVERKKNNTSSEMISDLKNLLFSHSDNSNDFIFMKENCKNEY